MKTGSRLVLSALAATFFVSFLFVGPVRANLLVDPGFENGLGWGFDQNGYASVTWWAKESGAQGAYFSVWGWGEGSFSQTVSAVENTRYYFRMRSEKDNGVASMESSLRLYWLNSSRVVIGSKTQMYRTVDMPAYTWLSYTNDGVSPPGTAYLVVDVSANCWLDGVNGDEGFRWDNAMLYDRPASYLPMEIVEEFSYDAGYGNSLHNKDRGNGFTANWSESTAGQFVIATGSVASIAGYPAVHGQKVKVTPAGDIRTASRQFDPVYTGTLFVAYMMNFQYSGASKWCGLFLMSNTTEKAFVGEINGADSRLGLDSYGGTAIASSYGLSSGMGNDYLIIAAYDFQSRELRTKAYYQTDTIPSSPPIAWDAITTVAVDHVRSMNGIRLGAGGNTPGDCYFDEVRVARDWGSLLQISTPPSVTNFLVNSGLPVTDGQITGGTYHVVMHLRSPEGVECTNTIWPYFIPKFDVVNPNGLVVAAGQPFSSLGSRLDSGRTVIASNSAVSALGGGRGFGRLYLSC